MISHIVFSTASGDLLQSASKRSDMTAWGAQARSCEALLDRVERNDPLLAELFILPTKTFGGAEVDRLAQIFEKGSNTHLQKLSASGHKIPDESLYKLGKAMVSAGLTSLAVGDDSMGNSGALAFTQGLKDGGAATQLQEIDLSWKGIGSNGFQMILSHFHSFHCPRLKVLNLSRNESIGANTDGNYSFQSISHVEELDLSQCGLSGGFVQKFFVCLQSAEMETKLKKLNIQGNPLKSQGFQELLPLFHVYRLQELNSARCQIDDYAIHCFLTSGNGLRFLDFSYNDITSLGACYLSEGFRNPLSPVCNLVELNLAGNCLGDEGVQALANALESRYEKDLPNYPSLEKLDLSNTNCGSKGAADIIGKGGLKSLYLFNNNLGSVGFMALAPTLKGGHATLEQLDLGGNGANQAAVVVLLSALAEKAGESSTQKSSLKVLVVGGNEGGDAVEQMAARIRQIDPTLDIARDKSVQRQEV